MISVEFICKQEKLDRRVCRIITLTGEARKFMEMGNDAACIAKYYAADIELSRLVNLVEGTQQMHFDTLVESVQKADEDPLPTK